MSNYFNFEDLEIWKEAMRICKEVYCQRLLWRIKNSTICSSIVTVY